MCIADIFSYILSHLFILLTVFQKVFNFNEIQLIDLFPTDLACGVVSKPKHKAA